MDLDTVILNVHRLLLDHLPAKTNRTPSGWQTFNCPMCTDTRRRGGVISDGAKITYHCFNCQFKTGWSPGVGLSKKFRDLGERLGASQSEINRVQLDLLKYTDELRDAEVVDRDYRYAKFTPYERPGHAVDITTLPDGHEIKEYARERGVLGLTELWWLDDTIMRKRLTIPFWHGGELVGWTGRHLTPSKERKITKYHTVQSPGYVYNLDAFMESERRYLVVFEGVFDAILLDGVAVLSNEVSEAQAAQIDKSRCQVIVSPDRDKPGDKLIEAALEYDWAVSFPPWDSGVKDAAEACEKYGRIATLRSIIQYSTDSKIKINVQRKLS